MSTTNLHRSSERHLDAASSLGAPGENRLLAEARWPDDWTLRVASPNHPRTIALRDWLIERLAVAATDSNANLILRAIAHGRISTSHHWPDDPEFPGAELRVGARLCALAARWISQNTQ